MSYYGYNPMRDRADPGAVLQGIGAGITNLAPKIGDAVAAYKGVKDKEKQQEIAKLANIEMQERASLSLMEAGYDQDEAESVARTMLIPKLPDESTEAWANRSAKMLSEKIPAMAWKRKEKMALRKEVGDFQDTIGGAPSVPGGERQDMVGPLPGTVEPAGEEIIGAGTTPGQPSEPITTQNSALPFGSPITMPESGSNQAEQPLAYPEARAEASTLSPEAQEVIAPQIKNMGEQHQTEQRMDATQKAVAAAKQAEAETQSDAMEAIMEYAPDVDPQLAKDYIETLPRLDQLERARNTDAVRWFTAQTQRLRNQQVDEQTYDKLRLEAQKILNEARDRIAQTKKERAEKEAALKEARKDPYSDQEGQLTESDKEILAHYDLMAKQAKDNYRTLEQASKGVTLGEYRGRRVMFDGDDPSQYDVINPGGSAPGGGRRRAQVPAGGSGGAPASGAGATDTSQAISPQDQQALRYLRENPNSPYADQLKQTLQAKGLL